MAATPNKSVKTLAEELNLFQSDDGDFLDGLITEVLEKNPDKVKAYKNGKKNLLQMFMGQVMRNAKGKADPKKLQELLKEKLNQ